MLALCLVIIIVRFTTLLETYSLLFSYLVLAAVDFPAAANQFSLRLLDYFISGLLAIALPLVIYVKIRHIKIFNFKLNFSSLIMGVLFFVTTFSPIISRTHPDFQKNIGLTKLLPPLSNVIILKFDHDLVKNESAVERFLALKNRVVKSSFDQDFIFVDSIMVGDKILYYQNQSVFEISRDSLKHNQITPKLDYKFFILGTDEFGRDIFSRLIYGARVSIFVGMCSVLLSFIIGLIFGSVSAIWGGWLDIALNRLTDAFLSFPTIFLIIIIIALFGSSMASIIFVLGFSGWMSLFKVVRSEVVSIKQKDFFLSAKMIGLSTNQLIKKEILPLILTPLIINLIFQFGNVILAEASLSYLGLGTGVNYPSWGGMIEAGQSYLKEAWWMILFPGLALVATLYSTNELGQKIKIYFNPQLRK